MTERTQPFVVVRDDLHQPAPALGALAGAVVAIGNFEGVHRGHRVVIGHAVALARALGRPAAVLTFEPHPRAYFKPDEPIFRLTDETAKLRLFAATALDGAIVLTFDAELAELEAADFVDMLVHRFGIAGAVVGFDFHFGKGRKGTPAFLAAEGERRKFAVEIVPEVKDDTRRYSSGAIRAALTAGDVTQAAQQLGFPWFVTGEVVHGDKRGRNLGYPTANLRLDPGCGLKQGVYAVRAGIGGQRYGGVASFGRRPMFDNGAVLLEVFIFDYSGDLYGKTLDVAFIGWIRPEEKFATLDELIHRMDEDSRQARRALAKQADAFPPLAAIA